MNAFEILGIEPTEDKKTIKKAYASLVKKYHPEEDMQKWQEIHEAYQRALEWAEGRNYLTKTVAAAGLAHPSQKGAETAVSQQDLPPVKENILPGRQEVPESEGDEKEQEKAESESEVNGLFDNLKELSIASKTEKKEQEKQKLKKAIAELEQIGRLRKLKYESFKELFFREEYQQAIRKNDFLYSWSKLLERRTVNKRLHQLMKEQLESIIQYRVSNGEIEETTGLMEPTRLARMRIDAAYDRYKENRKRLSKVAIFGPLIVLEVILFFIDKVHELEVRMYEMDRQAQGFVTMQYDPMAEIEKIVFREISLENMTETDLDLAGASWDGLGKFLMQADEQILSRVLPYTQTLEPGVLILNEEFEISKAIKGTKTKGKIGDVANSYELVPLSLPFDNQIQVGEETIDLPKKAMQFAIRTEEDADSVLLWVDPAEMGFKKGCEIYYFNGEEYQKVGKDWNGDGTPPQKRYYDVLTYRVFWVQVSRPEENEFSVIMAPIK